jgi:hypothetical protein
VSVVKSRYLGTVWVQGTKPINELFRLNAVFWEHTTRSERGVLGCIRGVIFPSSGWKRERRGADRRHRGGRWGDEGIEGMMMKPGGEMMCEGRRRAVYSLQIRNLE